MREQLEKTAASLETFRALRKRLPLRAAFLPADLALLGLVEDLIETGSSAVTLSKTAPGVVVYPLTRMAFEATQRIIALATDDDYTRAGVRAWLYDHRKDMRILRIADGPETAEAWFDFAVREIRELWRIYCPEADDLLNEQNERLLANEKRRGPDNFTCRDLATLVQERYPRVLEKSALSPTLERLNRAIYATLSRESHARLRIAIESLSIAPDGAVTVIPREVDQTKLMRSALAGLHTSLIEAAGALSYFMEAVGRERAERLRARGAQSLTRTLLPGYKRDFGLHLAGAGLADTTLEFPGVAIQFLGVLPDGTVSWSASTSVGDEDFMATFDVPLLLVPDLARALGVSPSILAQTGMLRRHSLPDIKRVRLKCTLGSPQRSNEEFLPLVAEEVTEADNDRA